MKAGASMMSLWLVLALANVAIPMSSSGKMHHGVQSLRLVLRGGMSMSAGATTTSEIGDPGGEKQDQADGGKAQDYADSNFQGKQQYDFHMDDWYTDVDKRNCEGRENAEAEDEPGLTYEEWIKRHRETQERIRIEKGWTHEETDYGIGYLQGRYGIEDKMGWKNYSPLDPGWQERASEMPQPLLDRHLIQAAADGDANTLTQLLAHGASISARNNESFLPATVRFGLFCESGNRLTESTDAVYGKIDVEEQIAVTCVYNWTAAHWAACYGHANIIELLASRGAPLDDGDLEGFTPLHVAAGQDHTNVVESLLSCGANATSADVSGNSPLHMASSEGNLDVAKALLKGGADADQCNGQLYTPLHWAASRGHAQLIRLLLAHGADANAECGTADEFFDPLKLAEANVEQDHTHHRAFLLLSKLLGDRCRHFHSPASCTVPSNSEL